MKNDELTLNYVKNKLRYIVPITESDLDNLYILSKTSRTIIKLMSFLKEAAIIRNTKNWEGSKSP